VTTRLSDGAVTVDAEATAEGDEPMPMGLGFHPYVRLPLGSRGTHDECEVWFDADELWHQVPPGLPTGEVEELPAGHPLRTGQRLGAIPRDVPAPGGGARNLVFRRRGGGIRAGARDPREGIEVEIAADEAFGALVFFTPPTAPIASLEPHTCVPDAFNLHRRGLPTGYQELAPGQPRRGRFRIGARQI
jgi:aldose 1-epimerase